MPSQPETDRVDGILSRRRESLIRALYSRHGRKKHGLCVCEGLRCCRDLHFSHPELIEFAVAADDTEIPFPVADLTRLPREHFKKLSATVESQGILMVARRPPPPAGAPDDPFILILDRISDPGNLGTIIRTARAVGLRQIWHTRGTADPFGDKAIRAAMASQFVVGVREFSDLEEIRAALSDYGYPRVFRTEISNGRSCFSEPRLFERSAIIMGSEAHGAGLLSGAESLTIPMPGDAESLNVAQAATVIMFEYVRRLESAVPVIG